MRKFQWLLFVLKWSYICYYIIYMAATLMEYYFQIKIQGVRSEN